MALVERWLPGAPPTADNLGTAKWLEEEHWRRMEIAVANGIAKAMNGSLEKGIPNDDEPAVSRRLPALPGFAR